MSNQIFPVVLVENNSDIKPTPFDFDPMEPNAFYQTQKGRCFYCGDPMVSNKEKELKILEPYGFVPSEKQNAIVHKKCKESQDEENKVKTEIKLFTKAIGELQTMIQNKITPNSKMMKSICLAVTCKNLIQKVTQKPIGTGDIKRGSKRCAAPPMGCGLELEMKDFAVLCQQKLPLEIQNSRSYSCLCVHCLCHPQKKNSNLLIQTLTKAVSKTGNEFQIDMAMDNVKRKEGSTKITILQKPEIGHNSGPVQWLNQKARCTLCSLPLPGWAKCNDCWSPPKWFGVNGFWSWVHESCVEKEVTERSLLSQEKGREFLHSLTDLYDFCLALPNTHTHKNRRASTVSDKATSVFLSVIYPQALRLAGCTQSQKRTQKLDDDTRKELTHLF